MKKIIVNNLPLVKILRFSITGVVTTIIHAFVAICYFYLINSNQILANIIAFILATLFSYTINTRWTFSTTFQKNNFRRYITVTGFGFALTLVISIIAQINHWEYFWAITIISTCVPVLSFVLHSIWTYQ